MQARQVIAATLLAITAAGAMAQEIDPSDTLQGKTLAAATPDAGAGRTRASVVAETRNLQADGQLQVVGERAEATPVAEVPAQRVTRRSRADVKAELALWRQSHELVIGERG